MFATSRTPLLLRDYIIPQRTCRQSQGEDSVGQSACTITMRTQFNSKTCIKVGCDRACPVTAVQGVWRQERPEDLLMGQFDWKGQLQVQWVGLRKKMSSSDLWPTHTHTQTVTHTVTHVYTPSRWSFNVKISAKTFFKKFFKVIF